MFVAVILSYCSPKLGELSARQTEGYETEGILFLNVCRNERCTFFFRQLQKKSSKSSSSDILKISLIYVFPASEESGCKLTKQLNQPVYAYFCHYCTHLFYIEGNGKEGEVHKDLVLSEMPETFVVHVIFYLSEHGFRFYASSPPVFQPFLGAK